MATPPSLGWVTSAAATPGSNSASVSELAGNVYTAYRTGSGSLSVSKTDKSGTIIWTSSASAEFNVAPLYISICVDLFGQTYTLFMDNNSDRSLAIFKLDNAGNTLLEHRIAEFDTGSLIRPYYNTSIVSDVNNHVFIAFNSRQAVDGSHSLTGTADVVVAMLDASDLTVQWSKQDSTFNSSGANSTPSICVDNVNQNIYVAYSINSSISGAGGTGPSVGNIEVAVSKFNYSGTMAWCKQYNSTSGISYSTGISPSITLFASNLYIAYYTLTSASGKCFGYTFNSFCIATSGVENTIRTRQIQASVRVSSDNIPRCRLASNEDSGLYVIFTNDVPNANNTVLAASQIFIAKLNSDGTAAWYITSPVVSGTSVTAETFPSIGVDANQNIYGSISYLSNGSKIGVFKYTSGLTDYVLTFDSVTGTPTYISIVGSANITIPSYYTPTQQSYTFEHWNTGNGVAGTAYSAGSVVSMLSTDVTLYAQWSQNAPPPQWTVTFNVDGGNAVFPMSVDQGSSLTLPAATKTGFTFRGWLLPNAGGTGMDNSSYTPTADVTLVAQWEMVKPGSGSPSSSGSSAGDPYVSTIAGKIYKLPAFNGALRLYQGTVNGETLTVNATTRIDDDKAAMDADTALANAKLATPVSRSLEMTEAMSFFDKIHVQLGESHAVFSVYDGFRQLSALPAGWRLADKGTVADYLSGLPFYAHLAGSVHELSPCPGVTIRLGVVPIRHIRSTVEVAAPDMALGSGALVHRLSRKQMAIRKLEDTKPIAAAKDAPVKRVLREAFVCDRATTHADIPFMG